MKITLIMAQTIDGKVARTENEFINWTGSEDKKVFVRETKRIGTVIMGRKTYDTIGHPLAGRHIIVLTRTPREAISDERGRVTFTKESNPTLLARLEIEGVTEVALGGGPSVNAQFLSAGLIDEIILTIGPKIFGTGLSLFEGIAVDQSLALIKDEHLTPDTLLLHYRVLKPTV